MLEYFQSVSVKADKENYKLGVLLFVIQKAISKNDIMHLGDVQDIIKGLLDNDYWNIKKHYQINNKDKDFELYVEEFENELKKTTPVKPSKLDEDFDPFDDLF